MAKDPRFFNGSIVVHEGAPHQVIGRSVSGKDVTYDLEDEAGERVFEIAEADLEPASDADVSLGQKPTVGNHADGAAASEGASITRE